VLPQNKNITIVRWHEGRKHRGISRLQDLQPYSAILKRQQCCGLPAGIDKLTAVFTVDAYESERDEGFNVQQSLGKPFVGFVECRMQFNPSGIHVGGG